MADLRRRLAEMPEEQRQFTLLHLAYHLSEAGLHDALYRLMDVAWRDSHFLYSGASSSFAADVSIALEAAAARFPADFSQCWRCSVIASTLSEIDTQLHPYACGLAASLGRHAQALALADATRSPRDRCRALLSIGDVYIGQARISEASIQVRKAAEAAQLVRPIVTRVESLAEVAVQALRINDEDTTTTALDMLDACELGHWMEQVFKLLSPAFGVSAHRPGLRRLTGMALRFPNGDSNLDNNRAAINEILAPALATAGLSDELHSLLDVSGHLLSEDQRVRSVVAVAKGLARLGDRQTLETIAATAKTLAKAHSRAELLGGLTCAYWLAGDAPRAGMLTSDALRIATRIKDELHHDSALSSLVRCLSETEQYGEAVDIASRITKPQGRSSAWQQVATDALARGQSSLAADVARQAVDAARLLDYEDLEAPYAAFEVLMRAANVAWQTGLKEEALEIVHGALETPDGLCDPTYGPEALTTAIEVLTKAGDVAGMDRAKEIAEGIGDTSFRDDAIAAVVDAFARLGEFDRALATVQEFNVGRWVFVAERARDAGQQRLANEILDRLITRARTVFLRANEVKALAAIASELARVGLLEAAQHARRLAVEGAIALEPTDLATYIYADGEKGSVLSELAVALARAGETHAVDLARAAWREASPDKRKTSSPMSDEAWEAGIWIWGSPETVLPAVARVLTRAAGWKEAFELMRPKTHSRLYGRVGVAAIEEALLMGRAALAHEIAAHVAKVALGQVDAKQRDPHLLGLVDVCLVLGDGDEALQHASAIHNPLKRSSALTKVATTAKQPIALRAASRAIADIGAEEMAEAATAVDLLCALGRVLSDGGRHAEAVRARDRACSLARGVDGPAKRAVALARCAGLMASLSESHGAERFLSESIALAMLHPAEEPMVWPLMASVAQQLGRTPAVLKAALDVAEPASRVSAMMGIVNGGTIAKDPALLSDVLRALKSGAGAMPIYGQLTAIALAFRAAAHPELALSAFQDACLAARDHRTMATFHVLERGAAILADVDNGALLLRIFHDTVQIMSWWRSETNDPQ